MQRRGQCRRHRCPDPGRAGRCWLRMDRRREQQRAERRALAMRRPHTGRFLAHHAGPAAHPLQPSVPAGSTLRRDCTRSSPPSPNVGRRGVLHSARAGLTVCNLVEALIRLGRWPEADALLAEHGGRESAPYAGAALRVLAAQLAVARGDGPSAASNVQRALDLDTDVYDIDLDAAFVNSEVARLAGEVEHAQRIVIDALQAVQPEWEERYVWPLVW